jgi:hypothetical protein
VIKAEQDLPGTEGGGGDGGGGEQGGEMTKIMYAHVNNNLKKYLLSNCFGNCI